MRVSIVCAMTKNRVIGEKDRLPWYLSEDLKKFRRLTTGHAIIMGRKTFESLPGVLPDRDHYVITRSKGYKSMNARAHANARVFVTDTPQQALDMAKHSIVSCEAESDCEVFIIGGGEIFEQMLPLADRLYMTIIKEDFEGDTFFPYIDPDLWVETAREEYEKFDSVIYDQI